MSALKKFFLIGFALPICFVAVSTSAQDKARSIPLQFPLNCTLDEDCFIQQFADMDESQEAVDPFCGGATYDGHKGTDFRLRTFEDIDSNIEVLAAAGGTIKGARKNRPDRLIETAADRRALKGVECGNGVVIDHGNTIETQYCHLKKDSVSVSAGDIVKAGDSLGYVGASGLAQFPHLHLSVRKDGNIIDPFTGNRPSQGCSLKSDESWWADPSLLTTKRDAVLLGSNITGAPIKHNRLVRTPPRKASTSDSATVGWVWYSNLKANDRVFIKLEGPKGFQAQNLSDPMNRNKASWSGFVGKKRPPQIGEYKLTTYILRKGENGAAGKVSQSEETFVVED
ncbi:M23 family metallopeptidase [Hellea sp.]|nr:M23 family metallopeptidase [Hellea sp.]